MFQSTDHVRCYSSVTQLWKLQMVSCWQSSAVVGYCWWSYNELQHQCLLVAFNCTSDFPGWCLQRLNDSISGWLMDRAKNWTTQLRQLLIQSSRYCATRLQLLSVTYTVSCGTLNPTHSLIYQWPVRYASVIRCVWHLPVMH